MNKVVLIGRLGKDAEVTTFENGKKVAKFTLATTEFYGEKKDVSWHNVDVWGDYGAKMAEYLKKGNQIGIEGRISYSAYEKDGDKRIFTSIVGDRIELLDSKKSTEQPDNEYNQSESQKTVKPANFTPNADTDDLPF
jgi:single-strand DNA-binding protein